jgi:hypothetical protein
MDKNHFNGATCNLHCGDYHDRPSWPTSVGKYRSARKVLFTHFSVYVWGWSPRWSSLSVVPLPAGAPAKRIKTGATPRAHPEFFGDR